MLERSRAKRRQAPRTAAVALFAAMLVNAPAASASQTSTWGWTTDTFTMSFFGGVPYVGCEKAELTVPDSGSTGTITLTGWSSIVVGPGATCSDSSVPSSLNANTVRVRSTVTRNGILQVNCDTGTTYNASGQGVVTGTDTCSKTSSADATWRLLGTYGWYDYDDTTWRSESVSNPVIVD